MQTYIDVNYKVYSTRYFISKALKDLEQHSLLSYDCETQSRYSLDEKAEAKQLLKEHINDMDAEEVRHCKLIAKSSGLSYPTIIKTTHFIFGISESEAVVLIANSDQDELLICNWIVKYTGKLLIHNSLFDLKIVYHRTGKFPTDYEDTQLLAKSYLNHTETWKANSGLKHLMSGYYDPKWEMIDTYDVVDYKDTDFLRYCAIDGAATFKLYQQLLEYKEK